MNIGSDEGESCIEFSLVGNVAYRISGKFGWWKVWQI